ncbi:MAG: DUF1800 domain-containing protein, partial [Planctomycetes bacterium]|nr:DUF1800 domain-containing protein [Planctomycetota bacterium]
MAAKRSIRDAVDLSTVDPVWAWTEYRPDGDRPWTLQRAGHLLRRAGFGADWARLQRAVSAGPAEAVQRMLKPEEDVAAFDRMLDDDEQPAAQLGEVGALPAWWLRRMILTPHPLRERMTLFWHGFFGISNARVNDGRLMLGHIRTLRKNALGSYEVLLTELVRDPAVLVGVGAEANRRKILNENLPRQLFEQWSVGPGQYGAHDVREAARAFTGWFVRAGGRLDYVPREHDTESKVVLGKKGDWNGEDVVRIVLEQPVTARMLARKLFRWLIAENGEPPDSLLDPLVSMLREKYDVGRVVATMLRSNLFFSDGAYRQRVKSPLEYALGIVRGAGATIPTAPLSASLASLGQRLYTPPTTSGWPGGRHWINAAAVLE